MESRAKLLGHPIHQMLIVFPLGLLATAVAFDLAYLLLDRPGAAHVAYWVMAAGLLGGVAAAPFGTIDWWAIPKGTRAKRVGLVHGLGNVAVLALFAGSWLLRDDAPNYTPGLPAIVLGVAGAGLSLFTAWLGGELVDQLGVGVADGANVDAPSSLSNKPAAASPGARAAR